MSVADLHPEDLLDREARGAITPRDRALLDAHLSRCSACRLEREARADFAEELAADMPAHDGSLLVARALEKKAAAAPETPAPTPRPSVRPRQRLRVAFFIAAALMLAGVAGATRVTGVWSLLAPTPTRVTPTRAAPPTESPRAPAAARAATADTAAALDAPRAATPIAPVPIAPASHPSPGLLLPHAAAQAASGADARGNAATTGASSVFPSHPVAPPAGEPPSDSGGAAALFGSANDARRHGEHGRAASLYRDLLARHPSAPEANATRVALGRLLLDDGDAAGALPLFETYLRGGDGALREEAMVGRARALDRLGRATDERAAWSTLLTSYPQSIHAARAHGRLEELGPR